MAGHSKWANIKHRKAASDAKRSRIFTRVLKEITVSARHGGGDPAGNPRLRQAIQEARNHNVPNDTIDRAVKKGTGELEGQNLEELSYEGYGPGGVAVLVETVTDNKNRTVGEVRHLFSRYGGNLGENGCVSWMFDKRGMFLVDASGLDEEEFMELALEVGAADFSTEEEGYQILTAPEDYLSTLEQLQQREEVSMLGSQLALLPQNTVTVDEQTAPQVLQLVEALEEHDDVQHVWSNYDIPPELAEQYGG
ncbi:MAG: YebC/PmpR family DNA-binding transcriptional regulator [Acidobacteria bacterium]|nr:MAG: YebC/PmpR family DNA-binding transcriptional regulator [Acidobacteriota bacterium]REK03678.1 MAG: YebC/PmpR family DNA-binding transcriptional regulator [Acidobacteriota bacterium]